MPKFGTQIEHQLGRDEAQKRLQTFADEIREMYQGQLGEMQEDWDEHGNLEFAFSVMGMKIDGWLVIEEEIALVKGNLPFAAVPFKGKVEQEIRNQLEQALA